MRAPQSSGISGTVVELLDFIGDDADDTIESFDPAGAAEAAGRLLLTVRAKAAARCLTVGLKLRCALNAALCGYGLSLSAGVLSLAVHGAKTGRQDSRRTATDD